MVLKGICLPTFPSTVWSWHWSEVKDCCYNRSSFALSHRQRTAELSAVESKLCLLPQRAQVMKARAMETRTALQQFPAPCASLPILPKLRSTAQPAAANGQPVLPAWCWGVFGSRTSSPLSWAGCCQGAVSFLTCKPSNTGSAPAKLRSTGFQPALAS